MTDYPLTHHVYVPFPAVDLTFTVLDADGTTRVDVMTGASLGQDLPLRLGTFTGTVSAEVAARIADDSVDQAVDEQLAEAGLAALVHPVSAVEVGAAGDRLRIASIGTEPFRLVVVDEPEGMVAQVWRDDGTGGRIPLPDGALAGLAGAGVVPSGAAELAPGDEVLLPLPPGRTPSGGFLFWAAPKDPIRRLVSGLWYAG